MRLLILFFYLVFHAFLLNAQEDSYTHYDTKDGLAGSTVHGMLQSKDGFIWFCTETGLSRFDGLRFKTFTTEDGLPDNQVLNIWADSQERLWIFTFKNAICYYAKGKIHNQENDSTLKKITTQQVNWDLMAETHDGDIIAQEMHFTHVITRKGTVTTYPWGIGDWEKPAKMPLNISAFSGKLHVNFLVLPDKIRKAVKPEWNLIRRSVSGNKPYYAFADRDTLRFITPSGSESHYAPYVQQKPTFLNDYQYVIYNNPRGVRVTEQSGNPKPVTYLPDYVVNAVIKDKEDNLWFSTQGYGVFKINPNGFKNLFATKENGNTYICDIHKIGSYIYIGVQDNEFWKFKAIDDSISRNRICNNPVLIVPDNHFLKQLPERTLIRTGSSDFLNLNGFKDIYTNGLKTIQSLGDTLLIANQKGAFLFSKTQKRYIQCLFQKRATCAYKQGAIYYIGTLNGLYQIAPDGKTRYMGDRFSQFKNNISTIAESDDGVLWIGTNGSGVYGYKEGRILAAFNRTNGLSSNLCNSLCASGNKLWIGSEKGLNKIDITPGIYKVVSGITTGDGLKSNIINAICADGNFVYVGTPVGVTIFNERNIRTHGICYLNMINVVVSGRSLDPLQRNITLKHQDNNISFEYAGISFLSEGDITYKYRIRGLNDAWKITREAVLTYPSLPSGKYTLELIAINKFHDESKPLKYSFEIEESIAETAWFKFIAVLVAVGIIILAVHYVIRWFNRKERSRIEIDYKIKSLEQMALRAQMNPHFIFNCLNSMQHYILRGETKKAIFYLGKFAGLVRETLDNATKVYISLEEEIMYLTNYIDLERLRFSDTFDYVITVAPGIDRQQVMIPNMVLQPYVENAIKHGLSQIKGHRQLKLTFGLSPDKQVLACIVEDNGIGIKSRTDIDPISGKQFPSKGMSITDKRILTLNQLNAPEKHIRITVLDIGRSGVGTGTQIIIHFPI